MDFLETLKQGIMGLTLFAGNWFLPANENASLAVASINQNQSSAYHVTIKMNLALNRQLEELIDAGVPLNMRFIAITDKSDTVLLTRSLNCNVATLTYKFSDSTQTRVKHSKEYPMILLALKEYCCWDFDVPDSATAFTAEVEILYSSVSQLGRTVDMSQIWGRKRVKTSFAFECKRG
jgi:hypothetical protein